MFAQLHDVIRNKGFSLEKSKVFNAEYGAPGHVPAEDVELLSDVSDFLAVVLVHLLQQVRRLHRQKYTQLK